MGASIATRTQVTDIRMRESGDWEVITDKGSVYCEHVVNAAGCYARQVSRMVGTDIPITNMKHTFIVTEPVKEFLEREDFLRGLEREAEIRFPNIDGDCDR